MGLWFRRDNDEDCKDRFVVWLSKVRRDPSDGQLFRVLEVRHDPERI